MKTTNSTEKSKYLTPETQTNDILTEVNFCATTKAKVEDMDEEHYGWEI